MNAGLLMELAEAKARVAAQMKQAQMDYDSLAACAARLEAELDAMSARAERAEAALVKLIGRHDAFCLRAASAEQRAEQAEEALTAAAKWKIEIPWESLWKYCIDGDYEPDEWREVDQWVRENIPAIELSEVQP